MPGVTDKIAAAASTTTFHGGPYMSLNPEGEGKGRGGGGGVGGGGGGDMEVGGGGGESHFDFLDFSMVT